MTGTIQLAGALPAIIRNGSIEGPGANLLKVRRNTGPEYRIFTIDHATFSISGLTISDGQLTAFGDIGAGIYNNGGTLTLTNCALTGHNGYAAGALSNQNDGSVAVSNCTFSGNTAFEGGAIDNVAISKNATLTVTNSTFSGNSATNNGGAIASGAIGASASLVLTNCTFSDNSPPTGGAVNNLVVSGGTSSLTMRNTIFKTGASGRISQTAAAPSSRTVTTSAMTPPVDPRPARDRAGSSMAPAINAIPIRSSGRCRTTAARPTRVPCCRIAPQSTWVMTCSRHCATSVITHGLG